MNIFGLRVLSEYAMILFAELQMTGPMPAPKLVLL